MITNGQALVKEKTRISDLYELDATPTTSRRLDYIYAEGQVVAVHVNEGGYENLYYVLTDHLGSWEKVLDGNKNTVQQTHFDPWGNRMSFTAWNTRQTRTSFTFDRGFTGHEHMMAFGLVNMNGRVYDPVTSTFLSVDNFVQDPSSTQSFIRYAYCMNNPLKYTDPDGEFFITFGLSFDKEHGISGFSLGLNFGLFGFGINSNWSNGFSLGAYAEVGPRIGNAGFTASIGVDYNFDYETTTASASAGYGFSYGIGRVGIGVGGSYTWGLSSKINPWNSNASVGLGLVGNISQFGQMAGFGLSCSYGTQGWNYGTHGFCEMLPLQEKLNRIVDYYKTELSEAIGNTNAKVLVGNNSNFRKNGVNACNIYGDIWNRSEKKYANGITIPGKAVGLVEFDEQKYVSLDSYIFIKKHNKKNLE